MRAHLILCLIFQFATAHAQELYNPPPGTHARMGSFENKTAGKGAAGLTNHGAKGDSSEYFKPGEKKVLLNVNGPGVINRIWFTLADRSPLMLRSMHLQMYWDHSSKPAVDVPFGDFFGVGLGKCIEFQSALLMNPRGRSFNCFIPMPFKTGAKVVLTNENDKSFSLCFYDIDFTALDAPPKNMLYFHAYWSRQRTSELGKDFVFLPYLSGKGRFLGVNFGVNLNPAYKDSGFGEGGVKMYVDGDRAHATIHGTGTEDYIGTGWGMGPFSSPFEGCTLADEDKGEFCFYRFHIPDPIWFYKDFKGSIQQLGGAPRDTVRTLLKRGTKLIPVSVEHERRTIRLLDMPNPPSIESPDFPDGWVNFFRVDDWSATAYFYLAKSTSSLPALPAVADRLN